MPVMLVSDLNGTPNHVVLYPSLFECLTQLANNNTSSFFNIE